MRKTHNAHAPTAITAYNRCSQESVIKILMGSFLLLTRLHSVNTTHCLSQHLVS